MKMKWISEREGDRHVIIFIINFLIISYHCLCSFSLVLSLYLGLAVGITGTKELELMLVHAA